MGTEAVLAAAFGVALGTFLTAAVLWLHERHDRKVLEDISTRLRRSESRLQAMLRTSHDILAVIDAEGMLTYASPAAERLFGRPIGPLLGTNPFTFLHPEDRDRALGVFFEAAKHPGQTQHIEARVRHDDGSWRALEIAGTNLMDDPAIGGFVVTAHDITERKRVEAELREAKERFRSAVRSRTDRDGAHRSRRALLPGQPRVRADARTRRGPARRSLDRRADRRQGPQRRRERDATRDRGQQPVATGSSSGSCTPTRVPSG